MPGIATTCWKASSFIAACGAAVVTHPGSQNDEFMVSRTGLSGYRSNLARLTTRLSVYEEEC